MRLIKIIFGTLMSFLLLGCSGVVYEKVKEGDLIISIGDHLTIGSGTKKEFAYPSLLAKKINRIVLNESSEDYNTKTALKNINEILSDRKPKLILLELGNKDSMIGLTEVDTYNNLKELIRIIKAAKSQVILLPTPNYKNGTQFLSDNEIYKRLGKEENILVISEVYSNPLSFEEYRFDKTRLNEAGYEVVANTIKEYLLKNGIL